MIAQFAGPMAILIGMFLLVLHLQPPPTMNLRQKMAYMARNLHERFPVPPDDDDLNDLAAKMCDQDEAP